MFCQVEVGSLELRGSRKCTCMPGAADARACGAGSGPRPHAGLLRGSAGGDRILLMMASCTCSASCLSGKVQEDREPGSALSLAIRRVSPAIPPRLSASLVIVSPISALTTFIR